MPEPALVAALREWLVANGGAVAGVEVCDQEGGERGVLATQDLKAGDVIMRAPYKTMFSVDAARQGKAGKAVEDMLPHLPEDELLAIALITERYNQDRDSLWRPWIDTLPTTYGMPIFWSDGQLALLQGSLPHTLTAMMNRQIAVDFENIIKPVFEEYGEELGNSPGVGQPSGSSLGEGGKAACGRGGPVAVTIEDYKWALGTIYSRSFDCVRRGKHVRFLMPYMDMTNHTASAPPLCDTHSFDDERDELVCCVAGLDKEGAAAGETGAGGGGVRHTAGCEYFFSYGAYSNAKLLYSYGWAPGLSHPVYALDVWLKLDTSDPLHPRRAALLEKVGVGLNQPYDFHGTIRASKVAAATAEAEAEASGGAATATELGPEDVEFDRRFMDMCRVQCCTEEELAQAEARGAVGNPDTVSERNERAVWSTVLRVLDAKVAAWAGNPLRPLYSCDNGALCAGTPALEGEESELRRQQAWVVQESDIRLVSAAKVKLEALLGAGEGS